MLIRRFAGGRRAFERVRHIFRFVLVALGATIASAALSPLDGT